MRSFTVTKGDPRRFRVLPLIEQSGWEPTFVCDTESQASSLRSLGVSNSCIRLSDVPKGTGIQGVSMARDYVCRKLMPKNEWCLWVDDNLSDVTGLKIELCKDLETLDLCDKTVNWRQEFEHSLTRRELAYHVKTTIDRADKLGTIFGAFANENNYYFRGKRWQTYGYCRTQLALYKNDGSTWFPFNTMMLEDMFKSIDVVCRYGSVVINRYAKAVKPQFEHGGIGSFESRLPWLQDNCQKLYDLYPGLVKYHGDGKQYGTEASGFHLTFAKRTKPTVDQWRKDHDYL